MIVGSVCDHSISGLKLPVCGIHFALTAGCAAAFGVGSVCDIIADFGDAAVSGSHGSCPADSDGGVGLFPCNGNAAGAVGTFICCSSGRPCVGRTGEIFAELLKRGRPAVLGVGDACIDGSFHPFAAGCIPVCYCGRRRPADGRHRAQVGDDFLPF